MLFLAEGCTPTGNTPDINEAAKVEWLPMTSIPDRIAKGEIIGAAAQVALLHILLQRSR